MSCEEHIPQRSQWKKLSRPPPLQIPQESQWYCCFFVCHNTWDEHRACYNTKFCKQSFPVLINLSRRISCHNRSNHKRRDLVNRHHLMVGTSHGKTLPWLYIKNKVLQREDVNLTIKEFADRTEVFAMILYIKNKVLQREDVDLNMKEFVDSTEVFAINNKSLQREDCQPHHQRICRLNRSIHPCIHHNFRKPAAHLAHDCKESIWPAPYEQGFKKMFMLMSDVSAVQKDFKAASVNLWTQE